MRLRSIGLIVTLALGILSAPLAADAQQPAGRIPRIGFLCATACAGPHLEAFLKGLRELGYVDGRNIAIEFRAREVVPGGAIPFEPLAAELVRLKVDVVLAWHPSAIRAAKHATKTIPIVMISAGYDPVETGLVASFARPGGNVTGIFLLLPELSEKRLELLKETVSGVSHIAVLWDHSTGAGQFREVEVAARSLGIQLQSLAVKDPDDFGAAFEAATRRRVGALIVTVSQMFYDHRTRIVNLATKSRLPAIFLSAEFVEVGGLMSYGPSLPEMFRRAAVYVDKILKGTKPADLPVEQPTKFELVINMKTAKALGLTIPPSVLVRAHHLIE